MIPRYVDYITRYVRPDGLAGRTMPGEHHFVGVYLLPKLHSITGRVPDYVNPDGTKGITGDVVYYDHTRASLGIEVKVGTIRLTANEFNSWIRDSNPDGHPNLFVGVGSKGLVLQTWVRFRETYGHLIKEPGLKNVKTVAKGKYGPQREVNILIDWIEKSSALHEKELFPWSDDAAKSSILEEALTRALRYAVIAKVNR